MAQIVSIGKRDFVMGRRPYIMGILNVTPDSFSDGGNFTDTDKALKHVKEMIDAGANIIDVGGESTRPGHTPISVAEELERSCFVIEAIKERFDVPVSLDTYKWQVAQAGILAGADMINDIWGFKYDDRMREIVAKSGVACCLMHNRSEAIYKDFMSDVITDLQESIDIALLAGVSRDKIMVDPGIGFAKNQKENLLVMKNLEKFTELGFPVLLGTSRKSFIGNALELPVEEREEGTIATSVMGLMKGCSFFRVHSVKENHRALKMAWSILNEQG